METCPCSLVGSSELIAPHPARRAILTPKGEPSPPETCPNAWDQTASCWFFPRNQTLVVFQPSKKPKQWWAFVWLSERHPKIRHEHALPFRWQHVRAALEFVFPQATYGSVPKFWGPWPLNASFPFLTPPPQGLEGSYEGVLRKVYIRPFWGRGGGF